MVKDRDRPSQVGRGYDPGTDLPGSIHARGRPSSIPALENGTTNGTDGIASKARFAWGDGIEDVSVSCDPRVVDGEDEQPSGLTTRDPCKGRFSAVSSLSGGKSTWISFGNVNTRPMQRTCV